MPTVDMDRIQAKLEEVLNIDEFWAKIESVKTLKLDFMTEDGKVIETDDILRARDLFADIVGDVVEALERVNTEVEAILTSEEKKQAVVKFIDECIKLPFYLELFDGTVIGILVDIVVGQYNKLKWKLSGAADGE